MTDEGTSTGSNRMGHRRPVGSLAIVLHGHIPWVMHHGRWPHGENWLLEAALEVYLPLLQVIRELRSSGVKTPITLGLTPILLEQLRSPAFQQAFRTFLDDRLRRARDDQSNPELAPVARYWEGHFDRLRGLWDHIRGDIPGAFGDHGRAGEIELLSSFATHGYAALLKHDRCIRAQLRAGLDSSERHLGYRPKGIWLPECSFRPTAPWKMPVLEGEERLRAGVDRILEEEGVTHFFVDAHLVQGARSEGLSLADGFHKVDWGEADWDPRRGWRSVLEPHRVGTHGGPATITAFARHPDVSEQVWSADGGYPGEGSYLEFHKRKDGDGLRYWRVTDRKAGLGDKRPYEPAAVQAVVAAHAHHFVSVVRDRLQGHSAATGREGCVTAAFDAELFGHWWFEGPRFLREVLLQLHGDPSVAGQTAEARLRSHPPDKVAWLPEGSWGAGGDHRVWLNEQTSWMWEAAYRCEDRFLGLVWQVQQRGHARSRKLLLTAARELLLLQASDWQFVIRTGGAVDYGFRRFCVHLDRFDSLCNLTQDVLEGRSADPVLRARLAEAELSDPVFPDLSLDAWT